MTGRDDGEKMGSRSVATSEESGECNLGRRLARDALIAAIVALLIHLGLTILGNLPVRAGAYSLHPRGLAVVAEFLGLLLAFELPVIFYRIAYDSMDEKVLRKSLRTAMKLFMTIPLIFGLWHVKLARFHSVSLDNDSVTIEGNSWLADHRFRLNAIDEVVLVHTVLYDELLFRWFDRVHASVFILPFDAEARRNVDALLTALKRRGIQYKVEYR